MASGSCEPAVSSTSPVLNFGAAAQTAEAELKRLVLSYTVDKVIAVTGAAGIGKTAMLQAVYNDQDVREKFRERLIWLSCDDEMSSSEFFWNLSVATKGLEVTYPQRMKRGRVGDNKALLAKESLHNGVADILGDWLSRGPRLLIVFDDFPVENTDICNHMARFFSLSKKNITSLVSVQSDRQIPKSISSHSVAVSGRLRDDSKAILYRYAGLEGNAKELSGSALWKLNDLISSCSGNPLQLKLLAGVIRTLKHAHGDLETAVIESKKIIAAMKKNESYDNLSISLRTFNAGICALRAAWPDDAKIKVEDVITSLSILGQDTPIPVYIYESLWKQSTETTHTLLQLLTLAYFLSEDRCNGTELLFHVNRRIREATTYYARTWKTEGVWHKKLLDGLDFRTFGWNRSAETGQKWGRPKYLQDEYFRKNIIRHLLHGGMISQAVALIVDYRWTEIATCDEDCIPLKSVSMDVRLAHQFLQTRAKSIVICNNMFSLEDVMADLRFLDEVLSAAICNAPFRPGEFAFQLHGRLSGVLGRTSLLNHYIRSIEKFAHTPWARPVDGLLQYPASILVGLRTSSLDIECVTAQRPYAVLVHSDGSTSHADPIDGCLKPANDYYRRLRRPLKQSRMICTSSRGIMIITSEDSEDKFVAFGIHDQNPRPLRVSKQRFDGFHGEGGKLSYICPLGEQPNKLVIGSSLGTLRVITNGSSLWELSCGSPISQMLATRNGHNVFVVCEDHIVRRVDTRPKSCTEIAPEVRGLAKFASLSNKDQLLAVCCGHDVRIYDIKVNRMLQHWKGEGQEITSMLFSRDDKRLFCGRIDGSVLAWNVRTTKPFSQSFRYHQDPIKSLSQSLCGKHLYSASKNRLCITRLEHSDNYSRELGETFQTQAFCLSPNGNIIVTAETDHICIRDTKSPRTPYEAMQGRDLSSLLPSDAIRIDIGHNYEFEDIAICADDYHLAFTLQLDGKRGNRIYLLRLGDREPYEPKNIQEMIELPGELIESVVEDFAFVFEGSYLVAIVRLDYALSSNTSQDTKRSKRYNVRWNMLGEIVELGLAEKEAKKSDEKEEFEWGLDTFLALKQASAVLSSRPSPGRRGTLDIDCRSVRGSRARSAAFDTRAKRLWVLNELRQLQFIDLVTEPLSAEEESAMPSLLPLPQISMIPESVSSKDS